MGERHFQEGQRASKTLFTPHRECVAWSCSKEGGVLRKGGKVPQRLTLHLFRGFKPVLMGCLCNRHCMKMDFKSHMSMPAPREHVKNMDHFQMDIGILSGACQPTQIWIWVHMISDFRFWDHGVPTSIPT